MIRFIIRRLLWMIPIILCVLFIVFTLNRLTPGDPVTQILGINYTQEQYDAMIIQLNLDKPLLVQFFLYVKGIVTELNLGTSYSTLLPVAPEIFSRLPTTLALGIIGTCITAIIGIPFGILSATNQNSIIDRIITVLAMFFAAMPNFWMALMMIMLLSLWLGWLPATGLDSWKAWIMPCLALGLSPIATMTRMTRSSMLEVINADYIRTAKSKGLKIGQVIRRHALRNALIPVVTVLGMQMSLVVGGSVIVETIFNIRGVGILMMTAINSRDYPTIQGIVLVLSTFVCLVNLLVDVVYAFIDPKIKQQYRSYKYGPFRRRRKGDPT